MSATATPAEPFRPAPLEIGSLRVFPPLVLAPMAGLTHSPLRRLLGELGGVGLYYSEMLSARALQQEVPGRSRFLSRTERDRPLCLQIFAAEPDQIPPAVTAGMAWKPEVWDLNFGCPAPEILKQGAGAALTRDLGRAWRMAEAMRQAAPGPLIFKIRAEESRARLIDFVRMLEAAGADAIAVHGRTAREKLCRPARWEPIAAGWGLPVPPLGLRTRSAVYRRLAKLLREHYGHPRDLYRLREFTTYFAKNYKFGHQLWKDVQNAADARAARALAKAFFARQEDDGERLA